MVKECLIMNSSTYYVVKPGEVPAPDIYEKQVQPMSWAEWLVTRLTTKPSGLMGETGHLTLVKGLLWAMLVNVW